MFFFGGWIETESPITEATTGLLYQPLMMMDDDEWSNLSLCLAVSVRNVSVDLLFPTKGLFYSLYNRKATTYREQRIVILQITCL
jgi:hypothetical protein